MMMPYASSSSPSFSKALSQSYYDVFMSFRGEDTGMGFISHLYDALTGKHIRTYKDDKSLEMGSFIAPEILEAIEASRFAVVVLSKDFATSKWCLEEIEKIVDCMERDKLIVFPVFYHVDPSDVRHQTNCFKQAFAHHEANPRVTPQKVNIWRAAFEKVGSIKGWHLTPRRSESEVVSGIVREVLKAKHGTLPVAFNNGLRIQLEDIKLATDNFAENKVIGGGGFGKVYIGQVSHAKGKNMVAIKRLNRKFGQGDPEFLKEIMTLSLYTHQNLISLLGFCDEGDEKVLVYEFASNGSLDQHLSSTALTWTQRIKICLDAARGLSYLHDPKNTHQRILHRDIKSSNILLDENWNAKVSDMGLSKIGPANQQHTFIITNVVGTPGYCDPQYMKTYTLTKESDVYSFGVVLFEVFCGRLCFKYNNGQLEILVPTWKQSYKQQRLAEIIFQDLTQPMKPGSRETYSDIAFQCLHKSREQRPSMSLVVEKLEIALKIQESNDLKPPMEYEEILEAEEPSLKYKFAEGPEMLLSIEESAEEVIGHLKITIFQGANLAVPENESCQAYIVLRLGKQKVQTKVTISGANPNWNEELMLSVCRDYGPVKLKVYNQRMYSFDDDEMGEAEINIQPLVTSATPYGDLSQDIFTRKNLGKWLKSPDNALLEDSEIFMVNGRKKQDVALQLQNVKSGIIYLGLQWIPSLQ